MIDVVLAILCTQVVPAGPGPDAVPFPAAELRRDPGSVELRLDRPSFARLVGERRLLLTDLPWDGGVDLELRRTPSAVLPDGFHADGVPSPVALRDASFWSGRIADRPGSDAFLAYAGGALWGWVRSPDELVHVVSLPGSGGSWEEASVLLITERALADRGLRFTPVCGTDPRELPSRALAKPAPGAPVPDGEQLLEGRLALETDWQFYRLFGDLEVAQGYVASLLAAANSRLERQVGVRLVANYVGLHTTPADPWTTQEAAGVNCIDLLLEFQAAWSDGGAPVEADLHHFLSGVDLGCGVAFRDALCDPAFGFSLTSRMNGLTPFAASPSPLNWDFVWMCHELGHNFGSVHTHQYCPPLDECAPEVLWGDCQDEQACTDRGTLMSYCHSCPGAMANYTTWYHPVAAQVMRAAAEASCFEPVPDPGR